MTPTSVPTTQENTVKVKLPLVLVLLVGSVLTQGVGVAAAHHVGNNPGNYNEIVDDYVHGGDYDADDPDAWFPGAVDVAPGME